MADRIKSLLVKCGGGINVTRSEGDDNFSGEASYMINYEPSLKGGYQSILGYSKYSSHALTGTGATLGVKVAMDSVFACRGQNIYQGAGDVWTKINTAARTGAITKYRICRYFIGGTETIVFCDGFNYALKYDGAVDTLLNGAGAPTNPKYATFFLNRLVLAGYTSNPAEITISAPSSDTTFSGGGAIALNIGEEIRALKSFRDTLYIFCKSSIFKLTGTSSTDFAIKQVTNRVGCNSMDSIQEADGDLLYADDSIHIRSLAATEKIGDLDLSIQSKAISPLASTVPSALFLEDNISSVWIPSKSQYRVLFNDTAASVDSQVGEIGVKKILPDGTEGYAWSIIGGFPVYCSDSGYIDNDEIAVFGTPTGDYIYQMESGTSRDGSNITGYYITPNITLEESDVRKVLMKIHVFVEISGNLQVSLSTQLDYGNMMSAQPPSIVLEQDSTLALYGTAIYGTDIYSFPAVIRIIKNLVGSGYTIQLTFLFDSDALPPHRIDSFKIDYKLKGYR